MNILHRDDKHWSGSTCTKRLKCYYTVAKRFRSLTYNHKSWCPLTFKCDHDFKLVQLLIYFTSNNLCNCDIYYKCLKKILPTCDIWPWPCELATYTLPKHREIPFLSIQDVWTTPLTQKTERFDLQLWPWHYTDPH